MRLQKAVDSFQLPLIPLIFLKEYFLHRSQFIRTPTQALCLIFSQFVDLFSVFVKSEDFVASFVFEAFCLQEETALTIVSSQSSLTHRMMSFT